VQELTTSAGEDALEAMNTFVARLIGVADPTQLKVFNNFSFLAAFALKKWNMINDLSELDSIFLSHIGILMTSAHIFCTHEFQLFPFHEWRSWFTNYFATNLLQLLRL